MENDSKKVWRTPKAACYGAFAEATTQALGCPPVKSFGFSDGIIPESAPGGTHRVLMILGDGDLAACRRKVWSTPRVRQFGAFAGETRQPRVKTVLGSDSFCLSPVQANSPDRIGCLAVS